MGRLFPIALLLPSIRTPCLREAICSMGNLMAVCIVWGHDLCFMEVEWRMVKNSAMAMPLTGWPRAQVRNAL